ncbi:MAG TPA: diacylglycerol kinase family protein [Acidimicrobiales bacterium]|nr:diacylglycerol kinase family protein [Acidimicrobiales bacterium]
MTSVAVVAHRKKTLGGGLPELRRLLSDRGIDRPAWYEVSKSRQAPGYVRDAIEDGADMILVWGGDGTVQRALDAVASSSQPRGGGPTVGIIPAGTANLLAVNLGIPQDLERAVDIALDGNRRSLDLGVVNGEHFGVMAGTGLDALMMKEADSGLKKRMGRLAYLWTGVRAARTQPVGMCVTVDGAKWFEGPAGCLLFGNMGRLTGGLVAFPDARYDDGQLEIGVVTAGSPAGWVPVLGRLLRGRPDRSKSVLTTRGREIRIDLDRAMPYELDGGDRDETAELSVCVNPHAVSVSVPLEGGPQ